MPKVKCKPLPPLTPADIARFWPKVDVRGPDECWPWNGGKTGDHYGIFYVLCKQILASRIAYFLHYGEDPYPLLVCHTCDNPPCCNGSHLFKGTDKDNLHDMAMKGRSLKGDKAWRRQHPERYKKGEGHSRAKLSQLEVEEIRSIYVPKTVTQKFLAKQYGISRQQIGSILRHVTWKSLP